MISGFDLVEVYILKSPWENENSHRKDKKNRLSGNIDRSMDRIFTTKIKKLVVTADGTAANH